MARTNIIISTARREHTRERARVNRNEAGAVEMRPLTMVTGAHDWMRRGLKIAATAGCVRASEFGLHRRSEVSHHHPTTTPTPLLGEREAKVNNATCHASAAVSGGGAT